MIRVTLGVLLLVACEDGSAGDAAADALRGDADPTTDAAPPTDAAPSADPPDLDSDAEAPDPEPVTSDEALALVDPFVGTGGLGFGYAALTPAAQVPNGLVRVGPDTTLEGRHFEIGRAHV